MTMNNFLDMLNEQQKKALLEALLKDSPSLMDVPKETKNESIDHIQNTLTKTATVKEDFTMERQNSNLRRKEQVKGKKNQWEDTGEDSHIETKYGSKTPRTREHHKKVEVDCSICGRSFKTDPKYVYGDYHRCSKCTGR
jgi:hypothetical protein